MLNLCIFPCVLYGNQPPLSKGKWSSLLTFMQYGDSITGYSFPLHGLSFGNQKAEVVFTLYAKQKALSLHVFECMQHSGHGAQHHKFKEMEDIVLASKIS